MYVLYIHMKGKTPFFFLNFFTFEKRDEFILNKIHTYTYYILVYVQVYRYYSFHILLPYFLYLCKYYGNKMCVKRVFVCMCIYLLSVRKLRLLRKCENLIAIIFSFPNTYVCFKSSSCFLSVSSPRNNGNTRSITYTHSCTLIRTHTAKLTLWLFYMGNYSFGIQSITTILFYQQFIRIYLFIFYYLLNFSYFFIVFFFALQKHCWSESEVAFF